MSGYPAAVSAALSSSSFPVQQQQINFLTPQQEAQLVNIPYQNKQRVLHDIAALLQQTNSLQPKIDQYHQNNGHSASLLCLQGTIPIWYKSVAYNIPVCIWLIEQYPRVCPHCYVTPTREMRIKEKHQHVDSQGLVYLPYLHKWNEQSSLVELITLMSSVFSEDPPVFRVTTPATPQPMPQSFPPIQQPQQQQQRAKTPTPQSSSSPHTTLSTSLPALSLSIPSSSSSSSNVSPPSPSESSLSHLSPTSRRRQLLITSLTKKSQDILKQRNKASATEMDQLFEQQQLLKRRREQHQNEIAQMSAESAHLSSTLDLYKTKNAELSAWLDKYEQSSTLVDVDQLIYPKDTWSKQLLEAVTLDSAIEDTMYCLDRALADDRLNFQNYVKLIRQLSRKQYFHRALANKIHKKQAEQQPQQTETYQPRPMHPSRVGSESNRGAGPR